MSGARRESTSRMTDYLAEDLVGAAFGAAATNP
jgi:hypothetical protein